MFLCSFELAAVFSQLRRDEIEIDRSIEFGFIAHLWNFLNRPFLFRGRDAVLRRPVGAARRPYHFRLWNWRQSVLVERPTSFKGAAAQFDVVILVAGEISKRKRIFGRAHNSQITLHSGAKSYARFGWALSDDRFH